MLLETPSVAVAPRIAHIPANVGTGYRGVERLVRRVDGLCRYPIRHGLTSGRGKLSSKARVSPIPRR